MGAPKKNGNRLKPETKEIIFPYLKKYPNIPNMTLAKIIVAENPDTFDYTDKDIDTVRSRIRSYRGCCGKERRASLAERNKAEYTPIHLEDRLPELQDEDYTPYVIPVGQSRMGIMNDLHCPYTEKTALKTAIKYFHEVNINTLLLNGDIFDFYQISRFDKNPSRKNMQVEFDMGKRLLQYLRDEFPKAKIYFKEGNHERRLPIFLNRRIPELAADNLITLYDQMGMAALKIEWIAFDKYVSYGNLNIIHGHEMRLMSTALTPPAQTILQRAKENTIAGHVHRSSEVANTTIKDKMISAWTIGCLCHKHVEFAIINQWNWGCAHVEMKTDGDFVMNNKKINGAKIY